MKVLKKASLILLKYFLNISKTSDFTTAFFTVFQNTLVNYLSLNLIIDHVAIFKLVILEYNDPSRTFLIKPISQLSIIKPSNCSGSYIESLLMQFAQ